jgi:zinc transport system substrate-binding protein
MVRPGQSPATYDPTPRQVAALARADLYLRVGVPFEAAWMPRLRAANPRMRVLDAREGIELRPHEGGDHGHDHGDLDPHVWTSPPLAKVMSANIRDALIELDAEHRADYEANYRAFAAELDALDAEIRALFEGLRNRRFLVYHPAWGYFAATYGLTQVAIERAGKEPGARALAALIDQARREEVRVIFVQPQFNRKSAERVARAIGGRVESMDPLAADYAENLRRVARAIAEADPG